MNRSNFKDYESLISRLRTEQDAYAKRQEAADAQRRDRAAFIRSLVVAFVEGATYETIGRIAAIGHFETIDQLASRLGYLSDPDIHDSDEIDAFIDTVFGGEHLTVAECLDFCREVADLFRDIKRDLIQDDLSEAA